MPAPLTGQVTTTGSAQQLDSLNVAASCTAFVIKAPLTNSNTGIFIGSSGVTTGTGHQLDPGDEIAYERIESNSAPRYPGRPSDFWVWIVTSGDKITWIAFP